MKTLVIHPDDRTTDFLKTIYEGKGYTVITDRIIPTTYILKQIRLHDRIMIMGHGGPGGLLGYFQLFQTPEFIQLLRQKQCVCIWCNANQYVERFGITGFYTGMFISEVSEAYYFGIHVDQARIDYSNNLFSKVMRELIEYPIILEEVKTHYNGDCEVIKFNNDRLYYTDHPIYPTPVLNPESKKQLNAFQTDKLIDEVLEQIIYDIEHNDVSALDELLRFLPENNLIAYLPDDRMTRWQKIQKNNSKKT